MEDILIYLKKNGNDICLIQNRIYNKIKIKHEWQLIEINITDYYDIKIHHDIYRKVMWKK